MKIIEQEAKDKTKYFIEEEKSHGQYTYEKNAN